ncbi:putative ubiquitin protein ligase E3a [Schistosoma mansoni]|uniref:putative ubiquitin protein ligase E3a n=1 Tax=Schistosoma mansoni TaxID=6183 RepID=UPI0001A633A3|nr:putative ubiquitin protein ligase E3a [Schistosoma mansoni]|eukprot:XP_018648508.1 putative ubiquitin protein ligase E3a [Schistosoma mansoni]
MLSDHPPICSSNRLPPWILCIELHRMYETNGTIKESNSPVSHPTSPSITGTNSKSGRKSSLSSTSSGYSAITSFSLTTGTCSSLPHFLPLGITPLATNQSQPVEVINNDDEDMDSHNHSLLRDLKSAEGPFKHHTNIQHSNTYLPTVVAMNTICCTQTLVSSKTSVSTSSSLQSLLQRSSEILPLMTRSGIEKPNVSNLHSVENPNAFVVKKTDCRSVRRRSTTNVSISDILSSTSTSLSVPGRVITPFSRFLRFVTNPLVSDDNLCVDISAISSGPNSSATTTTTTSVRKGPIRRGQSGGMYSSHQSFQGEKLVVKAKRQLQDVFSVLAGNFPSWLIQLISGFESSYTSDSDQNRGQIDKRSPTPFLSHIIHDNQPTFVTSLHGGGCSTTNFVNSSSLSDSTSLLIQLNAFSQSSFNTHLFDHSSGLSSTSSQEHKGLDNGRNNLGKYEKRLLKQAEMTLNEMGDSRTVLEIAFEGEVGFGPGPALEFYTFISRLLMKSNLNLWHGCESTSDRYLIAPAPGFYPRPFSRQTKSSVIREVCEKFNFLGHLLARALLDWRRLDLPSSPASFKWFSKS